MSGPRARVAVLLGGRSSEHEISVSSARSVIEGLAGRHDVLPIEIGRDGAWALGSGVAAEALAVGGPPSVPRGELERSGSRLPDRGVAAALTGVDVVFPVLHGPFGEDGTVQGLLELAGVPYVGSGVVASALCMDKDLFKSVLRDQGIPVTRNITLRLGDEPHNPFDYPVFVKPARLGSSVGITKAHDGDELRAGVELAFEHDEKVLVEEFVSGIEVEVGVLGNRRPIASLPGEIVVTGNEWYDYEAKYVEGEMELVDPSADQRRADRARTGARGPRLRRHGVRGHGPRRHVRARRRRGARQRAEHDPRLHCDECLCGPFRRLWCPLPRAARSPDRARAGAPRATGAAGVLRSDGAGGTGAGRAAVCSGPGRARTSLTSACCCPSASFVIHTRKYRASVPARIGNDVAAPTTSEAETAWNGPEREFPAWISAV